MPRVRGLVGEPLREEWDGPETGGSDLKGRGFGWVFTYRTSVTSLDQTGVTSGR